jgi:uncharacterized protein (DUF1501 family)
LPDARGLPAGGSINWTNGFLPARHQGVALRSRGPAIDDLFPERPAPPNAERASRDLLAAMNRRHLEQRPGDDALQARVRSYEMAARMQLAVPEVADLTREDAATQSLYGIDRPESADFGRACLLARRLLERGVRFVELFNGVYAMGEGVGNWDGHRKLKEQYDVHAAIFDRPAAALLRDLKERGLLEDTLVAWVTEFGRMPTFQKDATGRDHNPHGFTVWLAGAGVKAPFSFGATDEIGHRAVEGIATIHDLHATVLHLLGLDHERLSFYHNGIERRLTDVHGRVLAEVLA